MVQCFRERPGMPSTTSWQAPACVPMRSFLILKVSLASCDCRRLEVAARRTTMLCTGRAGLSASSAPTLAVLQPHWQWYATRRSWPRAFMRPLRECARSVTRPSSLRPADARPVRARSRSSLSGCSRLSCSRGGMRSTVSLPSSRCSPRAAPPWEAWASTACFIRCTSCARDSRLSRRPRTFSGSTASWFGGGAGPYATVPREVTSATLGGGGGGGGCRGAEKPLAPLRAMGSRRRLRERRRRRRRSPSTPAQEPLLLEALRL
mmetsp:Transcript_70522/g.228406  ORF Transcript_70522/g.228406 Transcript_70522/m.228406 type:complete len:263 (-) Transcript_70522:533-1321(-)